MWESVYVASWAELKFSFASNINWCSVIGDTGAELGDHPSLMSMGYVQGRVGSVLWCFPQFSDMSFYDNENYWIAIMEISSGTLIPLNCLKMWTPRGNVFLNDHIVLNILRKSLLKNKVSKKLKKMYWYILGLWDRRREKAKTNWTAKLNQ